MLSRRDQQAEDQALHNDPAGRSRALSIQ
jgi:hypothetical protein